MKTTLVPVAVILGGVVCLTMALAVEPEAPAGGETRHSAVAKAGKPTVRVRVYDRQGKLVGPLDSPKLVLTPAEWRKRLTPDRYKVLRSKGTEQAFCGDLVDNKKEGVYACAGCGLPLFASDAKFDSGTGWPSFMQPVAKENIETHRDLSAGMVRAEIHCVRCNGHLGHVFDDGPAPTGLRFCLNSASLTFTPNEELATLADPAAGPKTETDGDADSKGSATGKTSDRQSSGVTQPAATPKGAVETAVFAGGCFWCTEAVFEQLRGVSDVESGYCGGSQATADYEQVHEGTTRHAEAIRVTYDPAKIRYDQLLDVFFDAHDPTQLNRQGPADVGRQYRSAIFFANDGQKKQAEAKIKQLQDQKVFARRIVTRLEPLVAFYPAEAFHQDFASKYPYNPYIQSHAVPNVCDVKIKHAELIDPAK